ncbi:MAG: lipopolysaccharide transport periplasmic protein LptA [Gammaproteobacteria bacterium]|nr:lipopolysaccharide transport periplasmic protein LptA [Gammaproteobacteria bacterium]
MPTLYSGTASHLTIWHALLRGCTLTVVLLASPLTWALDNDRKQPLNIAADRAELNEADGYSIYTGNVIITQGSMIIEASTIKITFNDDGIERLFATEGNHDGLAYMRQKSEPTNDGRSDLMEAWAGNIDYNVNAEFLTLLGQAKLIQRGNEFSGNKILFDVPKDNVKATGGEGKRVNMIFLPKAQ